MPTPEQWRDRLEARLTERWVRARTGMGIYDAYFEGDHQLAFATAAYREAFGAFLRATADNWCPLVVESSVERLKVQGFRFGKSQEADDPAWEIWQANGLDAESDMAHTEAVKLGEAYWLVAPPKNRGDAPIITVEHPSQVIVACDPANRRSRLAALKKWIDEEGYAYANLYLPEGVVKWRSKEELNKGGMQGTRIVWVQDTAGSGRHSLGEVPVIALRNSPSMLGGGTSDLQVAIPIQDVVNKLLADMILGAEYQAFPQRVLLGVEKMVDADGQPLTAAQAQVQLSKSRILRFGSKDAKIDQWDAANLDNYVNARQHLIRGLTAKTRTPPHYVLGEIVNASGDALKAAETGLVAKVRKKMPAFGEGHEDAMRLAFKAVGDDQKAKETRAETIWGDPESRSLAELTDAMVKQQALGIPEEVIWEKLEYSPTEIDRMRAMKQADELLNPPPPPVAPQQNGTVPPGPPAQDRIPVTAHVRTPPA
jgi:hypothetical protein